jgi:methionine-S-sulfoxide reductase
MSRARAGMVGLAAALAVTALGATRAGAQPPRPARTEVAIFAGGCFWSTEKLFEETPGVIEAVSGYTGGNVSSPTYDQVVRGRTGHREAVRVTFDPARVSYGQLVERFWRSIDPADAGGVVCDRGFQYTTALFVASEAQRQAALASKARLEASGVLRGRPVATQILRAQAFWPAEAEHQDYWRTNPLAYRAYVRGCGREAALARVWGRAG